MMDLIVLALICGVLGYHAGRLHALRARRYRPAWKRPR
jgi:hypothetical protein